VDRFERWDASTVARQTVREGAREKVALFVCMQALWSTKLELGRGAGGVVCLQVGLDRISVNVCCRWLYELSFFSRKPHALSESKLLHMLFQTFGLLFHLLYHNSIVIPNSQ
jgi:hypothetical protein